jgi:hypothetical protein
VAAMRATASASCIFTLTTRCVSKHESLLPKAWNKGALGVTDDVIHFRWVPRVGSYTLQRRMDTHAWT